MSSERAGISERDYARHAGISRGAVRNARAAGRLVLLADGSSDATASDARRTETADPARQPPPVQSVTEPATAMKPVPEAAVGAVSDTLKEQGLPAPAVAGGMTYLQARTANAVPKAHERRLRLQKLRGELVDRRAP